MTSLSKTSPALLSQHLNITSILSIVITISMLPCESLCGELDELSHFIAEGIIDWRGVMMIEAPAEYRINCAISASDEIRNLLRLSEYPEGHDLWQLQWNRLDIEQKERLASLVISCDGLCALRRQEIAAIFGLDEKSRLHIEHIWSNYRSFTACMMYGGADLGMVAQWRASSLLADKQVERILTEQERTKLCSHLSRMRLLMSSFRRYFSHENSESQPPFSSLSVKQRELLTSHLSEVCHLSIKRGLLLNDARRFNSPHVSSGEFVNELQESEKAALFILGCSDVADARIRLTAIGRFGTFSHIYSSRVWQQLEPAERSRARLTMAPIEGIRCLMRKEMQQLIMLDQSELNSMNELFAVYRNELWDAQFMDWGIDISVGAETPIPGISQEDVPFDAAIGELIVRLAAELKMLENLPQSLIKKFETCTNDAAPHWNAFSEIGTR